MKVSLIATVKDAGDHIDGFLAAIEAQTRRPDEIVIVDGGSTDGTLVALREAATVRLIEEPGANIARGRNRAVASATFDVIAVTDADCAPDERWLERLLVTIEDGADIAMGITEPIAASTFARAVAATNVPLPDEIDAASLLPSARSLAVRRSALDAVGGWPEWLDIGEDMYVDLRWRAAGTDMRLARDAVVRWPMRDGLAATWRQYVRYARGDREAGMHARRHALRFCVYGAAIVALATLWAPLVALVALGAIAYVAGPIRRAVRRGGPALPLTIALVPFALGFLDIAKMVGWLSGRRSSPSRG